MQETQLERRGEEKTGASSLILLTGATGYVGGRLLPLLEAAGHRVRVLVRKKSNLAHRVAASTEVMEGDALDMDSLRPVVEGVHTAYYFIHSMGSDKDFETEDRLAARNFAEVARRAGVSRIVYLGGLGDSNKPLSRHLRSRQEIGSMLLTSGAHVIEFRASIIIGSGSLSFEMIRALVERLPVMICPLWVRVPAQPIAIEDVLAYLLAALDLPEGESRVFEIGGPKAVSYGTIMREYARQRGLRRWMIPVPVLTPKLSSLWLGLITPVYARVGRKLIESLRNPTVVSDDLATRTFSIRPRGLEEAIARALVREDHEFEESRWSDAMSSSGPLPRWGGVRFGSRLVDSRSVHVGASPQRVFALVSRIGGSQGWYYGGWLWRLRGFLDLLVGGVGMSRGRRHPSELRVGDVLDFWRIEEYVPNRLLRLRAEMRLPGRAWLEFEAKTSSGGAGSTLRQTAIFDPVGLGGLLYWYALYPVHKLVFAGMLKRLAREAERPNR